MADRYNQPNEVTSSTSTRRPLGSEIIRKRVDQLLSSSSVPVSLQPAAPYHQTSSPRTSNRIFLADGHSRPQVEHASPHERKKRPYSTSYPSNLDRTENIPVYSTTTSSVVQSHVRSHRPSASMQYSLSSESEPTSFLAPQRKENFAVAKRLHKDNHGGNIDRELNYANERDDIRYTTSKEPVFTGPLAVAEFGRLKQEIETLKETLHDYKKAVRRDKKKLEEYQMELNTALSKIQEQDTEISTLRDNHRKAEQTLLAVEHSIQCQICMELPDNPFALSPCGHTLCLTCLQEWFRKAPPALEDADIDPEELSDPHYILMRSKSCPSCRAKVKRRPVPIFMVKAVTSALKNAQEKQPDLGNGSDPTITDEDPWSGIFPSSDEGEDSDEREEDSELDSDENAFLSWYPQDNDDDESVGTGSEDEEEEEEEEEEEDHHVYVAPRWQPPRTVNQASPYLTAGRVFPEGTLKLLLRGCTMEMLNTYTLFYQHDCGIVLLLPGRPFGNVDSSDEDDSDDEVDSENVNHIFLGWNITLEPGDRDGEIFVEGILRDIRAKPEEWKITQRRQRRGSFSGTNATRLVRADETEEYDTTDTEIWLDAEES